MKIFALDTSTTNLCMLLMEGDRLLGAQEFPDQRQHSRNLLPGLQYLLSDANLTPQDLDAFVVGVGPGSFTGLRVGFAFLKGLAAGLQVKIAGISSFQIIAANASGYDSIVVVNDARQGKFYLQSFDFIKGNLVTSKDLLLLDEGGLVKQLQEKKESVFLGDALIRCPQYFSQIEKERLLDGSYYLPNPQTYFELLKGNKQLCFEDPLDLKPLYGKEFEPIQAKKV